VLSTAGYDLILYNVETVARRDECLRAVPRGERLDGLLILSLTPDDVEVQQFAAFGVPAVLVDAYHPALPTVQIDDVAGAGTAVRHLIDLGHRRIAYVGETLEQNPLKFQPIGDRYRGYRQTLDEAGISYCPEYHRQGKYGWREARRMTHELLDLPEPPTAIFAYSDTMAFGVLEAAQQLGVDVPGRLSVIGFDDVEIAQYFRLTTVRQPLHESGARGAELLLEYMDSDDGGPPIGPRHVVQPTELVARSTTGPPLS
jgi:DNA-binding LacI/PurR family transcriptional regulator